MTRADVLLWNVLCCSQKSVVECIWISHRDFLLNWTHTGSSQGDFSFFNFQLWFHLLSAQSVVKLFSNTYYITLAMVTCIDFRCLHFFPQCDKMEILFVCANIQNLYMQFLNYCFNLIVLFYLHYYCLRTVLLWMWNRKNVFKNPQRKQADGSSKNNALGYILPHNQKKNVRNLMLHEENKAYFRTSKICISYAHKVTLIAFIVVQFF